MIYGYVRVSTAEQSSESQKNLISRYAVEKKLIINDWIEVQVSSRKTQLQRRISELLDRLAPGDTVICSELSRLARSIGELSNLTTALVEKGCTIILVKQNLVIDKASSNEMTTKIILWAWSLAAELERDMISERTKEGHKSAVSQGKKLGKPKGTIQGSMYDADRDKIMEFHRLGVPLTKIVSFLGYGKVLSLRSYLIKQSKSK